MQTTAVRVSFFFYFFVLLVGLQEKKNENLLYPRLSNEESTLNFIFLHLLVSTLIAIDMHGERNSPIGLKHFDYMHSQHKLVHVTNFITLAVCTGSQLFFMMVPKSCSVSAPRAIPVSSSFLANKIKNVQPEMNESDI